MKTALFSVGCFTTTFFVFFVSCLFVWISFAVSSLIFTVFGCLWWVFGGSLVGLWWVDFIVKNNYVLQFGARVSLLFDFFLISDFLLGVYCWNFCQRYLILPAYFVVFFFYGVSADSGVFVISYFLCRFVCLFCYHRCNWKSISEILSVFFLFGLGTFRTVTDFVYFLLRLLDMLVCVSRLCMELPTFALFFHSTFTWSRLSWMFWIAIWNFFVC